MSVERHRRAKELFLACVDLAPAELQSFLEEHCAGDGGLRREVEALVAFERRRPDFLARDAGAPPSPAGADGGGPREIAGFRIVAKLGQGGMATVYEAEQDRPHRSVALKVLRGLASPSIARRFEFESELLGRLHHPGIAQVFEAGTAEIGNARQPYFVMELVRGVPITDDARRRGLGTRQRFEMLARVCDAVEHAHQHGVIHRDLKPANVLVDENGLPKVLDFGVARLTDSDIGLTTMRTDAGQVIGTLLYMSPEQASGDRGAVDTRADVYALGVIAYELLTEELPYDLSRASVAEALRIVREREPRPPSQLRRALRGDAATIVMKALEKDRERRYGSAAALAADVRRYLRDEPIEAKPASRSYKLRKFAARNRSLVAAAFAVGVSLVAATAVSLTYALRASDQRDLALASQGRAERRFADVRALANTMLFELHDDIATLKGATAARERIVEAALEYLAKLSADAEANTGLLRELAEAYSRIGDIQGHPRRPNLGRTSAALDSYRESLALRERIRALGGEDASDALAVSSLHQRIGAVQLALGEHAQALGSHGRAVDVLAARVAGDPGNVETGRALAAARALSGSVHEQMGQYQEALADYRGALDLTEDLLAGHPDDARLPRDLSISCNETALILERLEQVAEAEVLVRRGLEIRQRLAAEDPEDARALRDLALSRHRLGSLYQRREANELALEEFRLALEALGSIFEADPEDDRALYDLSVAHSKHAGVLLALGRSDYAIDGYRESCALREELVGENPENYFHAAALAESFERLANAYRQSSRTGEAEASYRRSLELAGPLTARGSDDVNVQTIISLGSYELACLLDARAVGADAGGDPRSIREEALALLRRSLEVLDEMSSRGMHPTHGTHERADVAARLAACQATLAE